MAISPYKTWTAGEILTAADLNASFSHITSNGQDIGWPATEAKDLDGYALTLDSDGDSQFQTLTDDVLTLTLQSAALFVWDGDVASPVNGLTWTASATGVAPSVGATGSDTNISLALVPKGTGDIALTAGGTETDIALVAAGSETNIGMTLTPKGTGQIHFSTAVNEAEGAAIASATTIDLDAATGNFVHVTGTTPITGVTLAQGRERTTVFDDVLTITPGVGLLLPGGLPLVTAAGDVVVWRGEGSSVTRCVSFQPVAQEWDRIFVGLFSGATSKTFTGLSGYRHIRVRGHAIMATDGASLRLQYSTDNGASYVATAGEYQQLRTFADGATVTTATATATSVGLDAETGIGNAAAELAFFEIDLMQFNQAAILLGRADTLFRTTAGAVRKSIVDFDTVGTTARDAFRLISSAGNISGHLIVEGMRG